MLIDQGDADAEYPRRPLLARLGGILTQRCPVCLKGPMFHDRWHLYDKCPGCGHHYRQPVGSARALMLGACTLLTVVLAGAVFLALQRVAAHLLPPQTGPESAMLAALGVQVTLVAVIYRLARAVWAHVTVRTMP